MTAKYFSNVADQLELSIAKDQVGMTMSDISSLLIGNNDLEDDDDIEAAEIREKADEAAESIFNILEERSREIGANYPLDVDGERIFPRKGNGIYLFLRLVAKGDSVVGKQREWFELLALDSLAHYFRGEFVRTGDPQRLPVPNSPKEFVQYVADLIGDGIGPVDPLPGGEKWPPSGDLNIDGFVYHRYPDNDYHDGAQNQLLLVVNCATGKDRLKTNKPFDPTIVNAGRYWKGWASSIWGVYCVPHFVVPPREINQASASQVLVFNGWRIAKWGRKDVGNMKTWSLRRLRSLTIDIPPLPIY